MFFSKTTSSYVVLYDQVIEIKYNVLTLHGHQMSNILLLFVKCDCIQAKKCQISSKTSGLLLSS